MDREPKILIEHSQAQSRDVEKDQVTKPNLREKQNKTNKPENKLK